MFSLLLVLVVSLSNTAAQDWCTRIEGAECVPSCTNGIKHTHSFLCGTSGGECCQPNPSDGNTTGGADSNDDNQCGVTNSSIWGVENTGQRSASARCAFPWLVSIRLEGFGTKPDHIATGILIRKNMVAVLEKPILAYLEVVNTTAGQKATAAIGEYNLVRSGDESKVYELDIGKTEDSKDGIRYFILSEEVKISDCVRPVCSAQNVTTANFTSPNCRLIGWGSDKINTKIDTTLPVPLQVNIEIESPDQCENMLKLTNEQIADYSTVMCIDFDGKEGLTQLDIGSAVVCKDKEDVWHLQGLVSNTGIAAGSGVVGPVVLKSPMDFPTPGTANSPPNAPPPATGP